ncbi:hypothetical protein MAXJ12_08519, partial [Mesorhizobium alhagi CCNWXJ12-2]
MSLLGRGAINGREINALEVNGGYFATTFEGSASVSIDAVADPVRQAFGAATMNFAVDAV